MTRIIAAAVRVNGVTLSLPPPARHYHIVNTLTETLGTDDTRYASPDDQGFLTDDARFVGREAALVIARDAGQIINPTPHRELFSEDLW